MEEMRGRYVRLVFTSWDVLSSVDSCIRSNGIELKFDEASGMEIGVKAVPFRIGPRVAIDVTRGRFD